VAIAVPRVTIDVKSLNIVLEFVVLSQFGPNF